MNRKHCWYICEFIVEHSSRNPPPESWVDCDEFPFVWAQITIRSELWVIFALHDRFSSASYFAWRSSCWWKYSFYLSLRWKSQNFLLVAPEGCILTLRTSVPHLSVLRFKNTYNMVNHRVHFQVWSGRDPIESECGEVYRNRLWHGSDSGA